jgi:hypothetical protein
MSHEGYNGYKNYETWNVSLWINNNEPLYRLAVSFMNSYKGRRPYLDFIAAEHMSLDRTPDGVWYADKQLSLRELNSMMREVLE